MTAQTHGELQPLLTIQRTGIIAIMGVVITLSSGCGFVRQSISSDLITRSQQFGAATIPGEDRWVIFQFKPLDDDAFARAFPYLYHYGGIERLDFEGREISDLSVSLLLQFEELKVLDLRSTAVSVEGLKRLRYVPHLDTLWLRSGQFTHGQLSEIRLALPKTHVYERP